MGVSFRRVYSLSLSANVEAMHAHKTTVTVRADHHVVPPGEAEVVITTRPIAPSPQDAVAEFDRFLAGLPPAPVVSLESLDRGLLNHP